MKTAASSRLSQPLSESESLGILSSIAARAKALSFTPAVLEAAQARQLQPYISLGSSPNDRRAERINSVYVAYQAASYGWIYSNVPAVRTVIEYVASNFAQLGLKVYKRVSDDEREHAGDHPASESLRRPNLWTPGQQLIKDFVTDFLIYDNAYILKFNGPGERKTLVNIPAHLVGIVGRSFYQPLGYQIRDQDGGVLDVPPEAMIHWRGKDTNDPRRGYSKLETLREELAADAASRSAVSELYRSGLALPGWIERPGEAPEWTEEARKRFQEDMANQAKAGKRRFPVFEEGMVFKQGGVTPEDAELWEGRRFTLEQVAALYGMKNVPPATEEERRQFYADVLPPITEICAAFFDLALLIQEYNADDHYTEFNLDEKRMSDDRIKTMISAAGGPIFTRDEARAKFDLPKLPDGEGEEIITPLNVTVGGKPSPQVMPIQDPNKPPQDGSHRTEDAPTPPGKSLIDVFSNGHVKATPLVPRRVRASHRRDAWAKQYEEKLTSLFSRQRQSLKSQNGRGTKSVTDDRWNNELKADLLEVSRRHLHAEGDQVAFRLATDFDPAQGQNWLDAKAVGASEAVNTTTEEHIKEKGLADAFALALSVRASAAGKAYATDVAGFATKAAGQQADVEPTVTIDGGECDVCAPFQGSYPLSAVEWPSYHPGCNCVADVEAGVKAVPVETKALEILADAFTKAFAGQQNGLEAFAKALGEQKPPQVNIEPTEVNVSPGPVNVAPAEVTIEKGALTVEPAQVNVEQSDVYVAPAEVKIAKGAITAPNVTVEAPPPAEVNVALGETHVAPAEVHIEKGAVSPPNVTVEPTLVNVEPTTVNVEAPPPANVNVEAKPADMHVTVERPPKSSKKVVRDKEGRIKEIVEEDRKQVVKRDSENRIESIEEE